MSKRESESITAHITQSYRPSHLEEKKANNLMHKLFYQCPTKKKHTMTNVLITAWHKFQLDTCDLSFEHPREERWNF
uniref:Uncharacterized protein n=1 Tax=Kalanchoe fedtschenkoi TaxID=63787 RepID=A0A7N0VJ58_KALFE